MLICLRRDPDTLSNLLFFVFSQRLAAEKSQKVIKVLVKLAAGHKKTSSSHKFLRLRFRRRREETGS